MKILWLSLLLVKALFATEYYAKAEPVERYALKAAITGEVINVAVEKEGKISDGTLLIMIDDKVNRLDLEASKKKLLYLQNNIRLAKQSVSNSYKAMQIAKSNYDKVKNLHSYTKVQKDAKLLSAISSTNSYIQTKTNLESLQTQLEDLKLRIATLEDTIAKKNIAIPKGHYIYKLYPTVGDFVTMGAPLVDSADISQARLTVFVTKDDLEGIEKKKIYIDDKETDYKIDKLWRIADSQNISAYKVEIIIDKPKLFSTLKKVEFR